MAFGRKVWLGYGVIATILEICSEGSAAIAADLLKEAVVPENSFAFLMTGVATCYTKIMISKGYDSEL
tara:strand:+ start:1339 stop:1542 length:204 start_codon:yes stop_codon:yes gene_type:complete